jgi:type IV pilus assembly protein PilY1
MPTLPSSPWRAGIAAARTLCLAAALALPALSLQASPIDLADTPVLSTVKVPGNVLLALSVEWPTANTPAYPSTQAYSASHEFLGYFDPLKCYRYVVASPIDESFFTPVGPVVSTTNRSCVSTAAQPLWSGNYLNWAAMHSLDIFRWTLTGGHRVVDTTAQTIIEKTRHSGQGARATLFPDKVVPAAGAAGATPFGTAPVVSRVHGLGTQMHFSGTPQRSCTFTTDGSRNTTFTCTTNLGSNLSCSTSGGAPATGASASCNAGAAPNAMSCTVSRTGTNAYSYSCSVAGTPACTAAATYAGSSASASCAAPTTVVDYTNQSAVAGTFDPAVFYRVQMRVRVCDATVGLEPNCVAYGNHHKPEGLMQQYAMSLRFGAFGYLNDSNVQRDGGVLRARLKAIGPRVPVPGAPSTANANAEWDAATGIFISNPNPADAAATAAAAAAAGHAVSVTRSGVINYLNEFGKVETGSMKSFDPVSEMYYAALRYLRNAGDVPTYSSLAGAGSVATMRQWIDGFPVITQWDDPIQYSCQRNFILGIGDVYTHRDRNLPGSTITSADEAAARPVDPTVNVRVATDMVGQLEGLANLGTFSSGRNNSYFIAGLAFDARTRDLRPDIPDVQTAATYWLDVLEGQTYESRNQFWLAAKYGGFDVPAGFDPAAAGNNTSTIPLSAWHTSGELLPDGRPRPDNYFVASNPLAIRQSLERAFAKIELENDSQISTAFATATPRLTTVGAVSYAASFIPKGWTGELNAHTLTFAADGTPTLVTPALWSANALLDARNLSTDPRIIVTCCTSAGAAMPFQAANLAATTWARTHYASFNNVPGASSQSASDFVAYLRGHRNNEAPAGRGYRARTSLLGSIVGSKANAVGRPSAPFLDAYNPGYSAFKAAHASRRTVVYVGANGGKMHAFDGTTVAAGTPCAHCGRELFAYVPSFVYGDSTTAATHGLAALGNPNYTHRFYVDATPLVFDVDFSRTVGATGSVPDWRSVLIGGLGKGGRGYYAIDVTDPNAWVSEAAVASRVLWEFTDPRMGFSFGDASLVKTRKYGWVVLLTSGYNNVDGRGYLFLVNPRTGDLLEAIATPASATGPINLAHHAAFVPNFGDFTADAVYAGDLQGNLWRFDLTPASGAYDPPTLLARLTDANGDGLPVTVRPLVEIDPSSNTRHVVVATGRLLADTDIASTQTQSIFVIRDGTALAGGFFTPATLPSGVSFPLTRADLNANTSLLTGIGSAPANPMGWFHDLRRAPGSNVAERVNVDMTANAGVVAVGVNLPLPEPCEPGGTGRVLAFSLASGRSVIVDATGLVESFSAGGFLTDVAILGVGGTTRLYAGTRRGEMRNAPWDLGGALNIRRMNWREVPVAN